MAELLRFTNADLPDYFAHQIRDFIRIYWFDPLMFDLHAPAMPDEWQPVYFVLAEEEALFSQATVVTRTVECNGHSYHGGGLGSVLTYPAFRNRGYGSQVVQAATDYLLASDFDLALLWTDADKAGFYARWGWEHHPTLRITTGPKDAQEPYEVFAMSLWLSKTVKARRQDFETHALYVGEHAW